MEKEEQALVNFFMKLVAIGIIICLAVGVYCCFSSNKEEKKKEDSEKMEFTVSRDFAKEAKVCEEMKSWGAVSARFNSDGYFIYGINRADMHASAEQIANAMFPMVMDVPGCIGVIIEDENGKELYKGKRK